MISTTLNSEEVYLLPYPDHWGAPPVLTTSIEADILDSKTGIERRQALASKIISEFAQVDRSVHLYRVHCFRLHPNAMLAQRVADSLSDDPVYLVRLRH